MTSAEAVLYIGLMFGAWSIGFAGGYLLTVFKRAMEEVA